VRRSAIALLALAALALLVAAPAGASTIVYTCAADLCAVEPDGSKQRRLTKATTNPPRFYDNPQVFPDGRRLLFRYEGELFISDARAKGRRRVRVPETGTIGGPLLRPDGRELFFLRALGNDFRAPCRVSTAAGAKPRCGNIGSGRAYWGWGPGATLVTTDPDDRLDICVTSLNGACKKVLVRLKEPETFYLRPALSPNGRTFAATVNQGTEGEGLRIVLFDARTGKHIRDVTKGRGDFLPAWSADGRRIVFQRGGAIPRVYGERGSICWVGVGGGKVRCPIRDRENVWEPSWGG
jgi:Tol biopolymer transport system component